MKSTPSIAPKSKRLILVGALCLAGALLAGISYFLAGNSEGRKLGQWMEIPSFQLPDVSGMIHSPAEFKGTPLVVHFWASWCSPCLDEIPEWLELAKSFSGHRVYWIAVSLDSNWSDSLKILRTEQWAGFPKIISLLDAPGRVPDRFGTYQYPETYFFDQDHKMVMKWVGPQNWRDGTMRKVILSVVSKT